MTRSLMVLVASSVLCFSSLAFQKSGSGEQQHSPLGRRVPTAANEAKQQGKNEVVISAPISEFWGASLPLDRAAAQYSLTVFQPIDKLVEVSSDEDHIRTWFKFRVTEMIIDRGVEPKLTASLPPLLGRLAPDEFAAAAIGGTLVVNGVSVVEPYQFPPFEIGKTYLAFLRREENGLALFVGFPSAVFEVTHSGKLKPITEGHGRLKAYVLSQWGDTLDTVRTHARH